MCQVLDQVEARGEIKGIASSIIALVENLKINLQEAISAQKLSSEQEKAVRAEIRKRGIQC